MSSIKNYVFDAKQIREVLLDFPELNKEIVVPKINDPEDEKNHPLTWRFSNNEYVNGYSQVGRIFTPYSKYPDESFDCEDPDNAPFTFYDGTLRIKCDASEYEEAKAAANLSKRVF